MIYYFSGTGNTRYVAETIANLLGEELKFIPYTRAENEIFTESNLYFIFPVYSWGVPPLVLEFIEKLPASFWNSLNIGQYQIHCIMTCGDEVALAPEMLIKVLQKRSQKLLSVHSVIMPNNYVLLPGFDVDSKSLEKEKLSKVPARIIEIVRSINQNEETIDVVRGNFAYIKTKWIYPLFKRWGINSKKWHYTDNCIGCGKCSRHCPEENIQMKNGHPYWGTRCCSCLACFHICPVHAVEYGKETLKKGQYFFPDKEWQK